MTQTSRRCSLHKRVWKKIVCIVSWCVLLFLANPGLGGEKPSSPEVITLEQALNLALEQNRHIANAQLEVQKAGDQAAAARKHFLPTFELKFSESYLLTASDYTFQKGVFGTYPGTGPIPKEDVRIAGAQSWDALLVATVAQPLSQLYKVRLGVEALELSREAAREGLRAQRQSVVSDVKCQYYTIAQTQNTLEATEELLKAVREIERVVGDRVARRTALDSDLLEVRAQKAKAEYELLTLRNALVLARQRLNTLMGRDLRREFSVQPIPEVPYYEVSATEEMKARAAEQRPELKASRLKVKQAETEVKMKKADYIPEVSLVFNYLSPFDSELLPNNVATVGVQLTWDVFDWGRKKRELDERNRSLAQARNQLHEAEALTSLDVQNRVMKLQEASESVRVAAATRDVAQEKLRVALDRYKATATMLQEVLQAQATLTEANARVRGAYLECITAQAELDKSMGREP